MAKKKWLLITGLALMLAASSLAGCTSEEPPSVTDDETVTAYSSLVDNLRATGATVESAGEITQPFFSVNGRVIAVNDDDVQVFEYADATTAEAEAALVSPDGSSVGISMVNWVATPHFYRTEKLIVLYTGNSETVTAALKSVLGQLFAGGVYISIDDKDIEDITWLLEFYGEPEKLQTVLAKTEITVLFNGTEGIVSGSAGANSYSAAYQLSENKLSIQAIARTEMYRLDPEGVMEQEDYYLKILQAAGSYKIDGGKLRIAASAEVLIFKDSEE